MCLLHTASPALGMAPTKASQRTLLFLFRLARERAGAQKFSKKEARYCFFAVYIKDMEQNSEGKPLLLKRCAA